MESQIQTHPMPNPARPNLTNAPKIDAGRSRIGPDLSAKLAGRHHPLQNQHLIADLQNVPELVSEGRQGTIGCDSGFGEHEGV